MGRVTDHHDYDTGATARNLQLQPLPVAPAELTAGRLWWDTTTGEPKYGDGTTAKSFGGDDRVKVTAFGAVGDGVTDNTVAIQAAVDAAALSGEELWFPPGDYVCGTITVVGPASQVILRGDGSDRCRLLLANGLLQMFHFTDLTRLEMSGLTLDSVSTNWDNVTHNSSQQMTLVRYDTTVATLGQKDWTVLVDNCVFTGNIGGQGQFRVHMYESATNQHGGIYSAFDRIDIINSRFDYYGNGMGAISIRGPGSTIRVVGCSGRNDGQYGHVAAGLNSETGIAATGFFASSCEVAYKHTVKNILLQNIYLYRTPGLGGSQMVESYTIDGVTEEEHCINPYYDTGYFPFTVDDTANTFSVAAPAPFDTFEAMIVQVRGADLPAPLIDGHYYITNSDMRLYKATSTPIDLTSAGSGTMEMRFMGARLNQGFKSDDSGSGVGYEASVHTIRNYRMFNSTPVGRSVVYEQSASTPRTARVNLVDCEFDLPTTLGEHPSPTAGSDKTDFALDRCRWAPNNKYEMEQWQTGSAIAITQGSITHCRLESGSLSTTKLELKPRGFIKLSGTTLEGNLTLNAPQIDSYFSMTDCVVPADVDIVVNGPTAAGTDYRIDIDRVRTLSPTGATARIRSAGSNLSDITLTAIRHDLAINVPSFGPATIVTDLSGPPLTHADVASRPTGITAGYSSWNIADARTETYNGTGWQDNNGAAI